MPDHRYPKQCYIMLRSLSDAGKMTRATQVKKLLYVYGFGYVWEANTIRDINVFVKLSVMQHIVSVGSSSLLLHSYLT